MKDFDNFLWYTVTAGAGLGLSGVIWSGVISLRSSGVNIRNLMTTTVYTVLAVSMFTLSLPSYTGQLDRRAYDIIPSEVKLWDRRLSHLELHHGYGLFR